MNDTSTLLQNLATPLGPAEQVKQKIAELQQRLQTAAPGYESILHDIHKALAADEAVTLLLTDEEVGIICAGLSKKKNIVLAESGGKSSSSTSAKLKSMLDDL